MSCNGLGFLDCFCGGDLCVCENHGEYPCDGCEMCEDRDDFVGQGEGEEETP